GGVTEEALLSRGLRTIGDIADTPVPVLQRAVGEAAARKLHDLSRGVDPRRVTTGREEKSIGHEVTFDADVTDADLLRRELLRQSTQVAARLRAAGVMGHTVVLKLRFAD